MLRSTKAPPSASNGSNNGGTATRPLTPRQDRNDTPTNNNSSKLFLFHSDSIIINPNTNNTTSSFREHSHQATEEISVSNLRKLYSSLLEELAPLHHELGTTTTNTNNNTNNTNTNVTATKNSNNANYRWKNNGTITVDGTDDTGYDYSYTPDNTLGSWRLGGLKSATDAAQHHRGGVHRGGQGVYSSSNNGKPKLAKFLKHRGSSNSRKIEGGITGGDWSKDGVRRYYTGGVTNAHTTHTTPTAVAVGGNGDKNQDIDGTAEASTSGVELNETEEVLISVENSTLDNNLDQLDARFSIQDDDEDEENNEVEENDDEIMFDVNILSPVPSVDVDADDTTTGDEEECNDEKATTAAVVVGRIQSDQKFLVPTLEPPSLSLSSSFVGDNIQGSSNVNMKKKLQKKKKQTAATIMSSNASMNSNSSSPSSSRSSPSPPPLSTFETLYNKNPTTSWRLRSAYMPTTPYEQQLLQSLGSGSSSSSTAVDNTTTNKARSIMSGINMAQNSEVRVCHSLKRIAEILCLSERRKGRKFIGDCWTIIHHH
jgi:hypothetical protein